MAFVTGFLIKRLMIQMSLIGHMFGSSQVIFYGLTPKCCCLVRFKLNQTKKSSGLDIAFGFTEKFDVGASVPWSCKHLSK